MTAPHPPTPLTLTVPEAAQRLGRSRDFIRRLIADHQVTATKHRGRWYLNTQSLEQWVQMGATNPTAPDPGYVIPAVVNQWGDFPRCELCGDNYPGNVVRDHCHVCGHSRGLLCRSCNALEAVRGNDEIAGRDGRTWGDWRQRCGRDDAHQVSDPETARVYAEATANHETGDTNE